VSPELRIAFGLATGVFWGLLFGLVPAMFGRRWDRQRDGVIAFWICFIGGLLFGAYVGFPVMLLTTFWVWRRRSPSILPGGGKAQELFR